MTYRAGPPSRRATVGLTVVLVGAVAFIVLGGVLNARNARDADRAGQLSDAYIEAAGAVVSLDTLQRQYRFSPDQTVRPKFGYQSALLTEALNRIRLLGGADDRAVAASAARQQQDYLALIDRVFAAVDARDQTTAAQLVQNEVSPLFASLQQAVFVNADRHRDDALTETAELRRLAWGTAVLTPPLLAVGGILVFAFTAALRRYRRELDEAAGQAVHDSLHDALTGLPNRVLLAAEAYELCADRSRTTALLLLDLDRFKEVNDTLGHAFGDMLLVQVGPRLRTVLGPQDTLARLGGDEFAVLLPGVADLHGALGAAQRLRCALERPFTLDGGIRVDVEASVGVVLTGRDGHDVETLLRRADVAMYVAKRDKAGVVAYRPAVDGNSVAKLSLLGELRQAVERGELELHYQPKTALRTGRVAGVEALVRWRHPERGMVCPDEFIPLAEHTGLIGPLTRYVLAEAVAQAARWRDRGRSVPVAVNLSARNLLDEELVDHVTALLAEHDLPSELLALEVTESAITTQPVRARRLLGRLRALGLRISVDDFGAGYTSLSQLGSLPVCEIKVDRSFVGRMDAEPLKALIVRSVIELGHNLGLSVVAEGVETEEALTALRELGCDVAQGYLIARPLPPCELAAWLADRPDEPAPAAGLSNGEVLRLPRRATA